MSWIVRRWCAGMQTGAGDGATGRREPAVMASLPSGPGVVHVGMDTSMREIVCGVLRPGQEVPAVERIPNDEASVRRLIGKLGDRRAISACYEAGPAGTSFTGCWPRWGWRAR